AERVEATLSSGHPGAAAAAGAGQPRPGAPALAPAPQAVAEPPRGSVLKSGWFWGAMGVLVIGAAGTVVLASQ
ncbi:MAG TPA: hypothetical protein VMF89_01730, partial [Polyangiales bacterium]|nr:hypothetical protein [Polyangiales bacterium]